MENLSKNLSDADEYPAMMSIHQRCISMLSHLWRIPKGETAIGTATTGSSEAIHLGGMAMKRRWVERRQKAGKDLFPGIQIPTKKEIYLPFSAIRVGKCLEVLAP
jgi:glutamate decarboxylase